MKKVCSITTCQNLYYAKGFCRQHYNAQPEIKRKRKKSTDNWLQNNREKFKISRRKFARTPKRRFSSARRRAINTKKLNWEVTFEEFVLLIELPCYYCNGNIGETGVGLDRLDNCYGYVLGNIVPCCGSCNFTKGKLEGAGFTYPRTLELMRELKSIKA